MRVFVSTLLCLALALSGAAPVLADKISRREKHRTIRVSYGVVVDIDEVKLKSGAGQGAVMGGMVGLAAGHGQSGKNRRTSAAAGALLGALLARAAEGKHKAEGYAVRLTDGSTVKIIMDHADAQVGDCVAIEEGQTSNLRRVAAQMCDGPDLHTDEEVRGLHDEQADACHEAKEVLLAAQSEAELDLAMKKVKVLCH